MLCTSLEPGRFLNNESGQDLVNILQCMRSGNALSWIQRCFKEMSPRSFHWTTRTCSVGFFGYQHDGKNSQMPIGARSPGNKCRVCNSCGQRMMQKLRGKRCIMYKPLIVQLARMNWQLRRQHQVWKWLRCQPLITWWEWFHCSWVWKFEFQLFWKLHYYVVSCLAHGRCDVKLESHLVPCNFQIFPTKSYNFWTVSYLKVFQFFLEKMCYFQLPP